MTTYFVNPAGDNSDGLSIAKGKRTVQSGLALLNSGDELQIKGGVYAEKIDTEVGGYNVPSGNDWASATIIRNVPGEIVWLRPTVSTSTILLNNRHYVIFDGIRLDGINTPTSTSTLKINAGSHHIRYINGEIKNSGNCVLTADYDQGTGFNEIVHSDLHDATGYGIYCGESNNIIDGNLIHDIDGYGIHCYREAPAPFTCSNNIVRNNKIYRFNRTNGPKAGMLFYGGANNLAYNNIITGQPNPTFPAFQVVAQTDTAYYNNTVYGNAGLAFDLQANCLRTVIRDNVIFGNGATINDPAVSSDIGGNITTDPLFVNAAGGDFHIASKTSPCCDVGANHSAIFTEDYDHVARPSGSTPWTVGAFEFIGDVTSVPTSTPASVPTSVEPSVITSVQPTSVRISAQVTSARPGKGRRPKQ